MLEAFSDLSGGNLALLILIIIAFVIIFFVFLQRLVGIIFWALVLFVVLVAGFSIYDNRLADAVKQLVSPEKGNEQPLQSRFAVVWDLLKQDTSEVLSKWQFLWSPSLKKEEPAKEVPTVPPPPPPPQTAPEAPKNNS